MLGLPFGTKGDRADWLEEACEVIRSLWTQQRSSFDGKQSKLVGALAEPKPVQQPHPPIWIGGSGRQRTLRITARFADVWNAAGGSPEEVAEVSAVLDRRCAEIGRDPRRSAARCNSARLRRAMNCSSWRCRTAGPDRRSM
jgi:alkanesulfonate monooxygenase SsuD/methylene tetrahydromethanopterin reductase-like flavin-dependent oxidoreductase (luciferase family)